MPLTGQIFSSSSFQSLCKRKKIIKLNETITNATGPLVKIAIPKKHQGWTQILLSSLEILLQKESRLIPTVAHKRESLTAALLQIIINGDKANPNDETNER